MRRRRGRERQERERDKRERREEREKRVCVCPYPLCGCRKEQSDQCSVGQCWTVLLTQTRQESRDHSALSEICCNTFTQCLSHCIEDTHRLAKKVPTHTYICIDTHTVICLFHFSNSLQRAFTTQVGQRG